MLKGIKINCETQTIEEVEVEGTYPALYEAMECDLIQPIPFDKKHDIHLDEEGFLKNPHRGYMVCAGRLLTGICIILRVTEAGNLKSHTLDFEAVKKQVKFLTRDQAYAYAQEVDKQKEIAMKNRPDFFVCMKLTDLFD